MPNIIEITDFAAPELDVYARLTDHQGNYLVGTREASADVLELNGVSEKGTIAAGYIQPYTLYWEWPFEEDDVRDTMLGNLAPLLTVPGLLGLAAVILVSWRTTGKPGKWAAIALAAACIAFALATLPLGIVGNTAIRVIADGADEEAAVEALVKLVESGFAE